MRCPGPAGAPRNDNTPLGWFVFSPDGNAQGRRPVTRCSGRVLSVAGR
ncbi:hypothetical protein Ae331Ps2_5806 [Pseudonocardia sp. Ae331_Ps2]|nr:hypothetical protein Ae331Ps2_5806 [Pseudonocardia sp. Ae331_Ps2]